MPMHIESPRPVPVPEAAKPIVMTSPTSWHDQNAVQNAVYVSCKPQTQRARRQLCAWTPYHDTELVRDLFFSPYKNWQCTVPKSGRSANP